MAHAYLRAPLLLTPHNYDGPYQWGCTGKFRFHDPAIAWEVATRRNARRGQHPCCVYACPHCAGWHIGGCMKSTSIWRLRH